MHIDINSWRVSLVTYSGRAELGKKHYVNIARSGLGWNLYIYSRMAE
jgi:hypothetical protein